MTEIVDQFKMTVVSLVQGIGMCSIRDVVDVYTTSEVNGWMITCRARQEIWSLDRRVDNCTVGIGRVCPLPSPHIEYD